MSDLLDDGMYFGVIVNSQVIESEYMVHTKYNPKGTCLNLWIDVKNDYGENKRLFKRLNRQETKNLLKTYDSKAGTNLAENFEDFEDLDASILNKERAVVEVQQYTSKVGKVSNIVLKVEISRPNKKVDF